MATQSVAIPQRDAGEHYDLGMLRLCQAKALTEVLGIAAKHGDDGVPMEDASFGIIELMAQAEQAFRASYSSARDRDGAE